MAKGRKKKRALAAAARPAPGTAHSSPSGPAAAIDLHKHTREQAGERVRQALRASRPGSKLQFITGIGKHSIDNVCVLKGRLENLFEAWGVRAQWHQGVFTVVVPDATTLERMDWENRQLGSPKVRLAAREEVDKYRAGATQGRGFVRAAVNADGAGLAASGEFPTLAAVGARQRQQKKVDAAIQLSKAEAQRQRQRAARRDEKEADDLSQALSLSLAAEQANAAAEPGSDDDESDSSESDDDEEEDEEEEAALRAAVEESLRMEEERLSLQTEEDRALAEALQRTMAEALAIAEAAWALEDMEEVSMTLSKEPEPEPEPEPALGFGDSRPKCAREGCGYLCHSSQGHGFCCAACRNGQPHGRACERIVAAHPVTP